MLEALILFVLVVVIRNKGLKLYNHICRRRGRHDKVKDFKEYSFRPLLRDWSFYPFLMLFAIYMVLQASIFMGHYSVGAVRNVVKFAYIATLVIIIFRHGIHKQGIAGMLCFIAGGILNSIAMRVNGGKMPVYPTFTLSTGYIKDVGQLDDGLHILGSDATKMKFLTDWIDDGWNVMSPGDILQRICAVVVLYYALKILNETKANKKAV